MNREAWVRGIVGALAAVALTALLHPACGGDEDDPGPAPTGSAFWGVTTLSCCNDTGYGFGATIDGEERRSTRAPCPGGEPGWQGYATAAAGRKAAAISTSGCPLDSPGRDPSTRTFDVTLAAGSCNWIVDCGSTVRHEVRLGCDTPIQAVVGVLCAVTPR